MNTKQKVFNEKYNIQDIGNFKNFIFIFDIQCIALPLDMYYQITENCSVPVVAGNFMNTVVSDFLCACPFMASVVFCCASPSGLATHWRYTCILF